MILRRTLWNMFGEALVARDGMICSYCGCQVFKYIKHIPSQLTIDHRIARSKGGRTALDNLCIACYACNQEKGDGEFLSFFRKKAAIRQRNRLNLAAGKGTQAGGGKQKQAKQPRKE